jgi:hypothetical protein
LALPTHFVVVGLLSLKKATIAVPLMIPLLITTFLFSAYIRKQHFHVASTCKSWTFVVLWYPIYRRLAYHVSLSCAVPSRNCLRQDLKNGPDYDLSFLKDAYLQPEMRTKEIFPDISMERAVALGLTGNEEHNTPAHSVHSATMHSARAGEEDDDENHEAKPSSVISSFVARLSRSFSKTSDALSIPGSASALSDAESDVGLAPVPTVSLLTAASNAEEQEEDEDKSKAGAASVAQLIRTFSSKDSGAPAPSVRANASALSDAKEGLGLAPTPTGSLVSTTNATALSDAKSGAGLSPAPSGSILTRTSSVGSVDKTRFLWVVVSIELLGVHRRTPAEQ